MSKVKFIPSPTEIPTGQTFVLVKYGEESGQTRNSLSPRDRGGRASARSVCNSVTFAVGLQGWRVVNNNIETKVNTLATSEK
jgi:hypothetical protein